MAVPSGQGWPDSAAYKAFARINDATDDSAIETTLAAVLAAVLARCPTLVAADCPEDVYTAVLLWTNRLMARRNSPDGIVGVADLGIATISRFDKDIAQMLSPYVAVVLS